jgi:hypothetical protein
MSAGQDPHDDGLEAMDPRQFRPTFQEEPGELPSDISEAREDDPKSHRGRHPVLGTALYPDERLQQAVDPP